MWLFPLQGGEHFDRVSAVLVTFWRELVSSPHEQNSQETRRVWMWAGWGGDSESEEEGGLRTVQMDKLGSEESQ